MQDTGKIKRYGSWIKRMYGIDLAEYDRLLAGQNGLCAICGKKPEKRLFVDHDPISGRVRGLLCVRCNTTLGWYEVMRSERILAYLERKPEVNYCNGGRGPRKFDRLSKWQRYRLKDIERYRKKKREYARTPEQKAKRAAYSVEWNKRTRRTRIALVNLIGSPNHDHHFSI